ncbi:MAG: DUF4139 domain-containing protein [Firmicutes bacterium]|nr:DUF4139 domain-containing protein [Bacillota bacterium]
MKMCTMQDDRDLCLTIYNDGFGLVSERRAAQLAGDETRIQYLDVAQRMEVESLRIEGLDVVEVNYEYDLVDRAKLLDKYVGETVYLKLKDLPEKRECRLLSERAGLILEDIVTGEVLVNPEGELILPKLPDGLLVRPALIFQIRPCETEEIGVSYLTRGLSWEAHYVAELKGKTLGLDAWVEIHNESGITFSDTRLKLLAGEVNRVFKTLNLDFCKYSSVSEQRASDFEEKSFSDYHLYTMQGTTTLKDNQSKQVRLFGANNVPYRRYYEATPYSEDVQIVIEINNKAGDGLGMPFPAGTFKVYQRDETDGGLTFVGEDKIGHTPKDESIRLYIGEAFDLQCERKCLNKRNDRGIRREQWRITLKNHKEEPAVIQVFHRIPSTADVEQASHVWKRPRAEELMFEVELKPDTVENIDFTFIVDERIHVIKHLEKDKTE